MRYKIIHILGASGSGTTTLGRALESKFGYHHLDVDDYYWLPTNPPFTAAREPGERINMLRDAIQKNEKCVISGSLCGWGDCFTSKFDLVIRIITPTEIRIRRLENREFERFGKRILPEGDMYEDHIKFIKWAADYDNGDISMRSKRLHDEWLKSVPCKRLVVDGTLEIEAILAEIDEL